MWLDIQLNVKGCKTLRDSFKDYIQEETLEGDNKYQAEGYGLQVSWKWTSIVDFLLELLALKIPLTDFNVMQDAKKGVIFESFPPVLHLQLKRFEYDIQRDAMVKVTTHSKKYIYLMMIIISFSYQTLTILLD